MEPLCINYHLLKACSSRCRFCFATFRDVPGGLDPNQALDLISQLRAAGGAKLTFAGGEPTLHPRICTLIDHAKAEGFTTCVVTNGVRLGPVLDACAASIDWVGFSVDSSSESTQAALGRGAGDHIAQTVALADRCRGLGVRIKLNTVVTALNWWEDMTVLVRRIGPERWKALQVLPIQGQNDGMVEDLVISAAQFRAFVDRHRQLRDDGIGVVAEDNDAMKGSYVMIDPLGRFFGNATGRQVYSQPILEVGVRKALLQVDFDPSKFDARGGKYAW